MVFITREVITFVRKEILRVISLCFGSSYSMQFVDLNEVESFINILILKYINFKIKQF